MWTRLKQPPASVWFFNVEYLVMSSAMQSNALKVSWWSAGQLSKQGCHIYIIANAKHVIVTKLCSLLWRGSCV